MSANQNFERMIRRCLICATIAEGLEKLYSLLSYEKRLDMYPILAERLVESW